jgi:hypothetical protein
MERLNGEVRDREKVMRGLKRKDTPILAGYQIFHNSKYKRAAKNTPAITANIFIIRFMANPTKKPLCRVVPLDTFQKVGGKEKDDKENDKTLNYDKDEYREMILDAAETVLGYFGFDRSVYENPRNNRKKKKWYEELQEERTKDIQAESMTEKQ